MGLIKVFESTQVTLNIEILSLIPNFIDQSSLFIELADEMELTFCEQIDNGCPVFLGMWDNVLKAEKKLGELLMIWEKEEQFVEPKPTVATVNLALPSNERKIEIDSVKSEATCTALKSCVVESSLILPSSGVLIESSETTKSPQLYFVSEESKVKTSQSLYRNMGNKNCFATTTLGTDIQTKQELLSKNEANESGIKDIYVDISVNPVRRSPTRNHLTAKRKTDSKAEGTQHPLDKLCQLLCIEEDETVDKRLSDHEQNKSEEKLPYKFFCDQCSFKAKRENHLLKHAKLHETIKDLFHCDECDFKTIRQSVLRRHKMRHSTIELLCKFCPYKTDTTNFLLKHLRARHGPTTRKKLKCKDCDHIASTVRGLKKHKKVLHKYENVPKFWKCSKCPYKSKLRAHLTRHENDVHGSLRQFLCHYCGKSFKRNDTLTQHKIIHGEISKTFTCQTCGKVCTSSVFFREHLASHTTERPFLCDVCGSSFKTRGATQRHKRAMHPANNSLLSCTQCGCIFKSRPDLNRHRKIHRCKTETTVVPGVISGASVQEDVITSTPITIQVVYTNQLESSTPDVSIK